MSTFLVHYPFKRLHPCGLPHRSFRSLFSLLSPTSGGAAIASTPSSSSSPKTLSVTWIEEDSSKISSSSTIIGAANSCSGSGGGGMCSTTLIKEVAFHLPTKDQQHKVSISLDAFELFKIKLFLGMDDIKRIIPFIS